MAKSKKRRKRKRKSQGKSRSRPPAPVGTRKKLAQAGPGLQIRAFEISDEVKDIYKPGITDEIAEATILLKEGHLGEAKAASRRIIEREPRAKEAYSNLAVAYKLSGDEEAAEALFRETMEKFPRYVFPRTNLAQTCLERGQVEEAEQLLIPLDKLRKFTSGEFRFYALTWSDILAARGNYEAALSWLRMLSEALPDSPGVSERRVRYRIGQLSHGRQRGEQK